MQNISKDLRDDVAIRLFSVAEAAAALTNPGELDQFQTPADMEKPEFAVLKEKLIAFAEKHKVLYVYYFRRLEDDADGVPIVQFIIDNDLTEDSVNLSTDPLPAEDKVIEALNGVSAATDFEVYSVNYTGLLSAYAPIFDEDGNINYVAGVDINDELFVHAKEQSDRLTVVLTVCVVIVLLSGFLNILLQMRKEKELAAMLDKTIQTSHAKSDFLSLMSHEMRTPMNAIIGMSTIAAKAEEPARKDYCIEQIRQASIQLMDIINDVLDMTNIEANKLELNIVPFNFRDAVRKSVDMISYDIGEKHQVFSMEIEDDIPAVIVGDEKRLEQVVNNLLSNASKFTGDGGRISLQAILESISLEGELVLAIAITDSGIGISSEQQSHLFTAFSQGEAGTARRYGGTGLGLAISKRIVELMGGRIWVKSEMGKGSTFTFNFRVTKAADDAVVPSDEETVQAVPAAAEAVPEKNPENETEDDIADLSAFRLLLAEDIAINQEIAIAMLEPTGVKVDCVENGREAFEKFSENPDAWDLILMDMQMPETDGLEATRHIRAFEAEHKRRRIPIIALTANVFEEDIKKCTEAGMDDHLGKPLDPDILIETLKKYLPQVPRHT